MCIDYMLCVYVEEERVGKVEAQLTKILDPISTELKRRHLSCSVSVTIHNATWPAPCYAILVGLLLSL